MGSGASKKQPAPVQVVIAPPAEELAAALKAREEAEATASSAVPSGATAAAAGADANEVNPWDYIGGSQTIVHSGYVWKLNNGADPGKVSEWLRRKMWLTDCGSLYYYSHQFGRPLGRSVAMLTARVTDDAILGRFIFELKAAGDEDIGVSRTMLAVESQTERDTWVHHFQEVSEQAEQAGRTGAVEPLDPVVGKLVMERKRLSSKCISSIPDDCIPADISQIPPATTKMERLMTPGRSMNSSETSGSGHAAGSGGQIQSSRTLRMSLNARLVERCKTLSASGFVMADTGQRPSCGPSAFLAQAAAQAAERNATSKLVRRDSQVGFSTKAHTVLVLDWDDTLFPTTYVRQDCGLDWRRSIEAQVKPGPGRDELLANLNRLADKVETFVNLACSLAHVVIVTLAKRPWVFTSADNFMPRLRALLQKHKIEVVYAREHVTDEMKADYAKNEFKANDQEVDFWMRAKANAMQEQLDRFHTDKLSWKNLLSIGDGEFERIALITTAERWLTKERRDAHVVETGLTSEVVGSDGHRKRLRTKTVKMLDEPALEEMVAQHELFISWLPHLVKRDRGIDIVIEDSEDDARLRDMDGEVTGLRRETMTWRRLAGIA